MKFTINENINITRFLEKLLTIIGTNDIVNNPKHLKDLVKIPTNKQGEPIAIYINTKRIFLQEPWNSTSNFYLDCQESISYDSKLKVNKHNKYSFNFEITEKNEIELKKFRIDYNQSQHPSLHAHDNNYERNNKHLEFPSDVKLLLSAIDVVTVLLILDGYIKSPTQYPLDNNYSDKYNGIIKKARVEYDDNFKNNLF